MSILQFIIFKLCVQVAEIVGCLRHMCTHQILNFTLKHGVHSDDEGSGRAQHLQQPWGQNGDVWVAAHMWGHEQWTHIIRYNQTRKTDKEENWETSGPFVLFMSSTLFIYLSHCGVSHFEKWLGNWEPEIYYYVHIKKIWWDRESIIR